MFAVDKYMRICGALYTEKKNLFVLNQFINFVSNYTIQLWA